MSTSARTIIIASALFGFSAIALGAYGDHGLRGDINPETMRSFETAVRYQIFHAIAALAIGIGLYSGAPKRLVWSAIIILCGTGLFAGSIYLKVIFGLEAAIKATPAGGIILMAGWLSLIYTSLSQHD